MPTRFFGQILQIEFWLELTKHLEFILLNLTDIFILLTCLPKQFNSDFISFEITREMAKDLSPLLIGSSLSYDQFRVM